MKVRTFDEWKARGFHVKKGQKATGRNEEGICTFTKDQVEKTKTYLFEYYPYEPRKQTPPQDLYIEEKQEIVYYADGSGYLKGGGPCGPLYFDRNGNT